MSKLQGTPEWHDDRKGLITGSVAGAILGLSPYMTADDVMRSLVRAWFDKPTEFKGNIATRWGNDHEDQALEQYETDTGYMVISTGFVKSQNYPWLGASPDGLVDIEDKLGEAWAEDDLTYFNGMVEVKCPFSQKITTIGARPDYWLQIQIQLEVTDRNWCDYYVWTPGAGTHLETVEREDITKELAQLKAFYDRFQKVIGDKLLATPYLKDRPEREERVDEAWAELAVAWKIAKHNSDIAQEQLDEAKKAVLALSEEDFKGFGIMVVTSTRQGSINTKQLLLDHPKIDGEKYRGKGSTSRSIRETAE